jgi:site-specific DNA-methyltransferase (adenine-specific)
MKLINDDCINALKEMESNSIDSIVTDPPAGIAFMGKDWDKDKGGRDKWIEWFAEIMSECKRVLKPGGHAFVWAIPRTSHWTATAIENAGFEIRDIVTHIFGSGFPKSQNISKAIDKAAGVEREVVGRNPNYHSEGNRSGSGLNHHGKNDKSFSNPDKASQITKPATPEAKQWDGWGTGLKPANEHWILCRKPISEKTIAKNVLKHGTGGLNIDGCRIEFKSEKDLESAKPYGDMSKTKVYGGNSLLNSKTISTSNDGPNTQGRFPANTIVDESAVAELDLQSGVLKPPGSNNKKKSIAKEASLFGIGVGEHNRSTYYEGSGGASRFFYCPKASKKDKNNGCGELITWENQDQNLVDLMEELNLRLRGTLDDTVQNLKELEWSTILSGKNISEQSQKDFRSTIGIMIKLITELKTLDPYHPLSIKDFIQDVIKIMKVNGLSHAVAVENINSLKEITTNEKTALALNASLAVLKTNESIIRLGKKGNIHSTVKNTKLMSYLIKMITPPNGIVLDPFMGSGSTGVAAVSDYFDFIGIEKEKEYFKIASDRINQADSNSIF